MKKIEHYKMAWNASKDEGVLVLYPDAKSEKIERIHVDSAAECDLLLDILNNEKPVFYQHGLLFTGFESVGESTAPITKDNLKLIEGIGPKIEGLLNEAGIHSFEDLKAAKKKQLKDILTKAGSRYKMHDPSTWEKQAKLAAAGKMEELKKWQDELKGGKEK